MANGEQRSNREAKKPKKEKPKLTAAAPMGAAKLAIGADATKKK
jgi:hypothetical protein